MVDPVSLLPELDCGIEALLEVGLHCRWHWALLVFGKTARLALLDRGHRLVKFFIRAYELCLGVSENIRVFGVDLNHKGNTLGRG